MSNGMLETALSSAAAGGLGTLFAPASAAAAGGALNVMGACAIGGIIVAPFAGLIVGLTGVAAAASLANKHYGLAALLGTLTVAEILAASLLAAEIGSAILGISAAPVFICSLVGSAVMAMPALLGLALLIALACICNMNNTATNELSVECSVQY